MEKIKPPFSKEKDGIRFLFSGISQRCKTQQLALIESLEYEKSGLI